jgi:S1-C subfamily serine protease
MKQRYQAAVEAAYKAAKLEDNKGIVQNLINTIGYAPPGLQNNSQVKPMIEEAMLLAGKYGISQAGGWCWIRPEEEEAPRVASGGQRGHTPPGDEEEDKSRKGIIGNGTGFFISSNGYILTNRHVAKPGDYLMVRLQDETIKPAERIVIDDEQDMAVLRIKVNEPVPFIRLAGYDHPPVGADVAVFGFPLMDRFGLKSSVKMTRGIVTAWDPDNVLCDVTVDATVNPGNSGGPMVDHHGNLLALTAMKTVADTGMVSTYGLGYSTQRIRKFFTKQKAKLADAKLESGKDDIPVLDNEALAQKLMPCTVVIFVCNGTPPSVDGTGNVKPPTGSDDN